MRDHADFIKAVVNYCEKRYGKFVKIEELRELGSGLVADAYKVVIVLKDGTTQNLVFRRLHGTGMSRDYLPDRIGYLAHQHDIASTHPNHAKSLDVVVYGIELSTISLDRVSDVFHVMEFSEGESYTKWIKQIANERKLSEQSTLLIKRLASYLASLHKIKPVQLPENTAKHMYMRHSQDYIGGEVFMDIIDVWPENEIFTLERRTNYMQMLFAIREELKGDYRRMTRIHADFHPDNIRIKSDNNIEVLDATRAKWGEPADDTASMLANYIYYSIKADGKLSGSYEEAYNLFINEYLTQSEDNILIDYIPMFLVVRLMILAHPMFFVDNTFEITQKLITLGENILKNWRDFQYGNINKFL
jgi:thiamine kinase-like enzyme